MRKNDHIQFFKLQVKNLYRDYKTRVPENTKDDWSIYLYSPRFFNDIDGIFAWADVDEDSFTLMNTQHIIANLSGFNKWADLIDASNARLELGKLLLEHRSEKNTASNAYPLAEGWKMYLSISGLDPSTCSDESLLNLFKHVFLS